MKRSLIGAALLAWVVAGADAVLTEPRAEARNGEFQFSRSPTPTP